MAVALKSIEQHEAALREKIFHTETKWPHFNLLFSDIKSFADTLDEEAVVVGMERTLLYGGKSLFAPYFSFCKYLSIDCSPPSADERGAYNRDIANDSRIINTHYHKRASLLDSGLSDASADLVLVPNLVHHVKDQVALFNELSRIVKPGGTVYIFEPILRELHQMPDDYLRYTPFGISDLFEKNGMEVEGYELEGGPFTSVAYCWAQALQYFPEEKRESMSRWFYEEELPRLLQWDKDFTKNQVRENTQFPVAFSIRARMPNA